MVAPIIGRKVGSFPWPAELVTEVDGRTILTLLVQLTSKEGRDMVLNSGMGVGMQQQLGLLEQLAVSLR
jgi:hypothetical protein